MAFELFRDCIAERGVDGLQGPFLPIDISETQVQVGDEPNADGLAVEDLTEVEFLAVLAETSACSGDNGLPLPSFFKPGFFKPAALPLKLAQPPGVGDLQATELGLPFTKCYGTDPVPPTGICRDGPGLPLTQDPDNMFLPEP